MSILSGLLVVAAMAFLNRFRGGGFGAEHLPGHPRFYVAPVVGALCLLIMPWWQALAAGIGYLAWSWPPWGYLMCLGRFAPQDRAISRFEVECLRAAGGDYHGALFWRHFLLLLPLVLVGFPGAVIAAGPIVAAYEIGWRLTPKAPIQTAEILTGAIWGCVLVFHF